MHQATRPGHGRIYLEVIFAPMNETESNSVDLRVSRSISLRGTRKLELIGQIFNVFGRDNLQAAWVTNALSDQFDRIRQAFNRQQGEVAIRFAR
jgi:hypothetical protein